MCFVDNVTVTRIFFPSLYILKKRRRCVRGDKYAKPSFLKLQGIEYTHTRLANTLVLTPPGQTLLAMELIIHNRCSEMFSRIYDGAQRNSQVSLWCCFPPLSYKDKGLHRERMSAQPFSSPKAFPLSLSFAMRDARALIAHRASGPWGEVCSFIPMILCGL